MNGVRRSRDERGAVAVLVGAFSLVMVLIAAFVIDIGMQRVARRDMQALADVVALDLARDLTGDALSSYDLDELQERAEESRERNDGTLGGQPDVVPVLGMVDTVTGEFTPAADPDDIPNGVRVAASTTVGFAFVSGSGAATREAVASADEAACIRIGSSALDLHSADSTLLGPILGDALGVSAVSYEGLLDAQVTLGDLAVALGAGSTDELLAMTVSVADFYAAIVEAAANDEDGSNDGIADVLSAELLESISANATLQQVTVADLLSLGEGDDAALASTVDVLDLVTGAAYVANGENALAIPTLNLAPLGITASLYLIEPPRLACRRGTAQTAQLRVVLRQNGIPVLGGLGGLVTVATVNLEVTLDLARARGGVGSLVCEDGEPSSLVVQLSESTLVGLTTKLDVKLLGLPVTSANLPTTVPGSSPPGSYTLPLPESYDTPYSVPSGATPLNIPNVSQAQLSLLGINLGVVGGLVVGVVNPALGVLTNVLNTTVAPLLGLRLGGADLFAVRGAECASPMLVG